MLRKFLGATALSASALAFAAAAGAADWNAPSTQQSVYDTPTFTRNMSEGLMGQASLEHMDIRSSEHTAMGTASAPGPEIVAQLNHDGPRDANQMSRQSQGPWIVETELATFPVRSFTSTASEGLASEQLALQERVLFDPGNQLRDQEATRYGQYEEPYDSSSH